MQQLLLPTWCSAVLLLFWSDSVGQSCVRASRKVQWETKDTSTHAVFPVEGALRLLLRLPCRDVYRRSLYICQRVKFLLETHQIASKLRAL
jgi:hypothetical protein